jgi:hypothetical protein
MTFRSGRWSFLKVFLREFVSDRIKQRLVVMLAASEGEELDAIMIEVDFCSDQPMWPLATDGVRVTQNGDLAAVGSAADKDDMSSERSLKIEFPVRGKRTTWRGLADADRSALTQRREVVVGSLPQLRHAGMFEALPDFGLPESVEALDRGLKSSFVGWREDGCDAEAQAQPNDTTHCIEMLSRTGKTIVVVELSEFGQTESPPVPDQVFHGLGRSDRGARPGSRQPAQQRCSRKNCQVRAAPNGQSFDGIERIQFGLVSGHGGKMPSLGRRGATHPAPAVQETVSRQDASDRSHGRTRQDAFGEPLASNGHRPDLAQHTTLQSPSQCENVRFPPSLRPLCLLRSRRAIVPIDAIEALSPRTPPPMLHGREWYTPLPRSRSLRQPTPDRCHHFSSLSRSEVFQP